MYVTINIWILELIQTAQYSNQYKLPHLRAWGWAVDVPPEKQQRSDIYYKCPGFMHTWYTNHLEVSYSLQHTAQVCFFHFIFSSCH